MIELRKATAKDAALLARTRKVVWEETYRGIYPDKKLDEYDFDAYTNQDLAKLNDIRNHYYLFMDADECAGYFSFGPYHYGYYKDFELCLNHLYIRKEYKGRRLGATAFELLRGYCASRQIDKFFCGCNAHNLPAIGFYRHMGGIPGDAPHFHEDPSDDIIHFEFQVKPHE